MSSTINNGSQNLTFDYRQEGTSEGFNKLLYTLIPQGILKGGNLSINSGLIVNIAPMTCYFKDETNEVGVRIETRENATVTLSQAKPYVVGEFTWINTEDNFMEFKAVDLPSDGQIVFGRGIFASVNTISGFDTTYKTWSKEYYENINEDGTPSFKVTVNPNNQLKLDVGKGHAIINGKEVTFTNTVTSGEINTNVSNARIDYLCITENGALTFVSSEDVSVPTNPSIPYNMLAIAKITLPSNPTSILGKVEYIYNNHQQTPSMDSIISTISSDYNTLNNAKQDKITNTVQTSQPTDSNYVGGFTNSSTSTNPTSHNSWKFENVWNWVKTHLGVRSGTTDSAIGSSVKPVYCDNTGKLIALSDNNAIVNLGSTNSANLFSSSPSFGVTGILGVANGGTGANTLPSGALLQGNGTGVVTKASSVGNSTTPIYIDSDGKAKSCSNGYIYIDENNYTDYIDITIDRSSIATITPTYNLTFKNLTYNTNYDLNINLVQTTSNTYGDAFVHDMIINIGNRTFNYCPNIYIYQSQQVTYQFIGNIYYFNDDFVICDVHGESKVQIGSQIVTYSKLYKDKFCFSFYHLENLSSNSRYIGFRNNFINQSIHISCNYANTTASGLYTLKYNDIAWTSNDYSKYVYNYTVTNYAKIYFTLWY